MTRGWVYEVLLGLCVVIMSCQSTEPKQLLCFCARPQASAAVYLNSSVFYDLTQHRKLVSQLQS